jgi:hypothetical protein
VGVGERMRMTVGAIKKILERVPPDEELFLRVLDGDGDPMFLLVAGVTIEPDGIVIHGGVEVD